jgi:hypothetical protein
LSSGKLNYKFKQQQKTQDQNKEEIKIQENIEFLVKRIRLMTQSRFEEPRRRKDSNTSPSVTLDEKLRVPSQFTTSPKETVSSNIADFLNRVFTEDKSTQVRLPRKKAG